MIYVHHCHQRKQNLKSIMALNHMFAEMQTLMTEFQNEMTDADSNDRITE